MGVGHKVLGQRSGCKMTLCTGFSVLPKPHLLLQPSSLCGFFIFWWLRCSKTWLSSHLL